MAKAKEAQEIEASSKVYELATHIISSLPEEEVAKAYADVKDLITKAGGSIISEEAPKLTELAYIMIKRAHGKNIRHSTAHFSWVKFEMDPTQIAGLHDAVEKDENVLRFIIIKTVKENTLQGNKFANEGKENSKDEKRGNRKEKAPVEPVAVTE
jgi:ribosomal protein S6